MDISPNKQHLDQLAQEQQEHPFVFIINGHHWRLQEDLDTIICTICTTSTFDPNSYFDPCV